MFKDLGYVLLLVVLSLAFDLAATLAVAWLAVWVFAGFGYDLPFWPTVGACYLARLLLRGLGRRVASQD